MFFLFLFLSIIYPLKGGVSLKKYYIIGPVGKIDEAGRSDPKMQNYPFLGLRNENQNDNIFPSLLGTKFPCLEMCRCNKNGNYISGITAPKIDSWTFMQHCKSLDFVHTLKETFTIATIHNIEGHLCPLEMLRQTFCYRREKEIPYLINISLSLSIKTILF